MNEFLFVDGLMSIVVGCVLYRVRSHSRKEFCATYHAGSHDFALFNRADNGSIEAAIDDIHGCLVCSRCGCRIPIGSENAWHRAYARIPDMQIAKFREETEGD